MTANATSGELVIELEGQSYKLRPSFEAAQAVEQQCGPLLALAGRALRDPGTLSLSDLAVIIAETMKAGGQDAKASKVAELIYKAGIPVALDPAVKLLGAMVTGGRLPDPVPAAPGKD